MADMTTDIENDEYSFGQTVYDEDGNELGTIRGFDEHGFYVSTDQGITALSGEHFASGLGGEAELMWGSGPAARWAISRRSRRPVRPVAHPRKTSTTGRRTERATPAHTPDDVAHFCNLGDKVTLCFVGYSDGCVRHSATTRRGSDASVPRCWIGRYCSPTGAGETTWIANSARCRGRPANSKSTGGSECPSRIRYRLAPGERIVARWMSSSSVPAAWEA